MSGLRVNLNVALGAMVNDHHAVVNGRSFIRVRCVSLLLSHALTHTYTRTFWSSLLLNALRVLL